jgi:hypothetical protein
MMLTPSRRAFAWRCDRRSVAVFDRQGQLWAAFLNYIELVGLDVFEKPGGRRLAKSPFQPRGEVLWTAPFHRDTKLGIKALKINNLEARVGFESTTVRNQGVLRCSLALDQECPPVVSAPASKRSTNGSCKEVARPA